MSSVRGPCAKRRVRCELTAFDGTTFVGENDCANPQPICPRAPGEGYEKCTSVCRQAGHAEIEALRAAGAKAEGAVAELYGHYYLCEPCAAAMRDAGAEGRKSTGGSWFSVAHNTVSGKGRNPDGRNDPRDDATKCGGDWFNGKSPSDMRHFSSGSTQRNMASAMIAKIPFALSSHIARTFYPRSHAS